MVARATGFVSIPDQLLSEEAAPILCAGIATFNALKKSGAESGDTVAILGIGGLGHLALQYARKMGFRVVAAARGDDIAQDAMALGAHRYIDTNKENAAEVLNALGGANAILTTTGNPEAVSALMPALAPEGRLVLLGVGKDPLPVSTGYLVGAERDVIGSITGSPFENERTLDFSVLAGVRPMIETMPIEHAAEAVERMRSGNAKFRIVLTMGRQTNAHHDDLTRPVIVHSANLCWVPSPAAGVNRRMLYRVGGEVARATSIVRYAPGSAFPRHVHSGVRKFSCLRGCSRRARRPSGWELFPLPARHIPCSRLGRRLHDLRAPLAVPRRRRRADHSPARRG